MNPTTSLALGYMPPLEAASVQQRALADPVIADDNYYFAASRASLASAIILPAEFDDALESFGADLYWRMLLDPQVWSTTTFAARSATAKRLVYSSPLTEDDPDYKLSQDVALFVADAVENAQRPPREWLFDLSLARGVGHRVAVPLFEYRDVGTKRRLMLSEVRVKPHESYSFVSDRYRKWRGIVGRNKQGQFPSTQEIERNPRLIIPMEDIIHAPWGLRNHDPRGWSLCRVVYGPWWSKMQTYPTWLAYLATWATPGLMLKAKNGGQMVDYKDPVSGVITRITRIAALMAAGRAYRNQGILGMDAEDDGEVFQPQGSGDQFTRAITTWDMQIAKGQTGQTMATEQPEHYSRAGGGVHQDVLDADTLFTSLWLGDIMRDDVARKCVMLNDWGVPPERARRLVPLVGLGEIATQDFATVARALGELRLKGIMQNDQLPWAWRILGMPPAKEIDNMIAQGDNSSFQPEGGANPNSRWVLRGPLNSETTDLLRELVTMLRAGSIAPSA